MQECYGKDIIFNFYNRSEEDLGYLKKFDCGNSEINKYFNNEAISDTKSVTKVIWRKDEKSDKLNKEENDIIGLYSVSASAMFYDDYDDKKYIIPAIEIKFFAINQEYQDMPFSEDYEEGVFSDYLFASIINNIRGITENECGAEKIVLYSVPDAVEFYKRNGFEEIEYKDTDLLTFLNGTKAMVLDLLNW